VSPVEDTAVPRVPALDEPALNWVKRGVWAICVAVYMAVFVGGIHAGSEELGVVARAAGFTLVAALLGRVGLGLLEKASLPGEPVPMDDEEGRLGSRIDMVSDPNLAEQEDLADAA
jgi:hypothetical protein